MDRIEIIRRIVHCIVKIYASDSDLLTRNNHELTISAKLAQYLFVEFKDYNVDCEYNRHINQKKYCKEYGDNVRPDIVIHRRGEDKHNLVYIEIKTEKNHSDRENDKKKVIAMTRQDGGYGYALGFFMDFARNESKFQMFHYEDGKEIKKINGLEMLKCL